MMPQYPFNNIALARKECLVLHIIQIKVQIWQAFTDASESVTRPNFDHWPITVFAINRVFQGQFSISVVERAALLS